MTPHRRAQSALASWFFCHLSVASAQQTRDTASNWAGIFGLIQSGDRLAAAERRLLAMSCFLEAQHQIVELARNYPHFEPELIAFRIGTRSGEIAAAGTQTVNERELSRKLLAYIQSLELGQTLRFRNEFEPALSIFEKANSLLDEIGGENPGEFDTVLKPPEDQLGSTIEWLRTQVANRERKPSSDRCFTSVSWMRDMR